LRTGARISLPINRVQLFIMCFKLLVVACLWAPVLGDDNADMVQMQLGSNSRGNYYYYDDSDGQKWLANMSFSVAGLDYSKIMASGPLHFGILWNIKSEIASGFGVPFENVSIFLSDAGNLNVAAVVVGPWMTKLDPTPDDIDTHLMERIRAIPDIDSARTEGFTTALRLSVSTRRHDDGLWTTTTTTSSDGRRRRSPATHAPTTAPTLCLAPYGGSGVTPGGQNSAAGIAVTFECANPSAQGEKHPATGQVKCNADGTWGPYSSGADAGVTPRLINWGCGAAGSCFELPYVTITNIEQVAGYTASTKTVLPDAITAFVTTPGVAGSVVAPFPPVAPSARWCDRVDPVLPANWGRSSCCKTDGYQFLGGSAAVAGGGLTAAGAILTDWQTAAGQGMECDPAGSGDFTWSKQSPQPGTPTLFECAAR